MPENFLELQKVSPEQFSTIIKTSDGIEYMELHRPGLSDSAVLKRLNSDRYSRVPGSWVLTIPHEQKVFREKDFKELVAKAISYFWDRDHPDELDDYFI